MSNPAVSTSTMLNATRQPLRIYVRLWPSQPRETIPGYRLVATFSTATPGVREYMYERIDEVHS